MTQALSRAEQKNLLELVRVSRAAKFRTPVLAGYVDGWLATALPPKDVRSVAYPIMGNWD